MIRKLLIISGCVIGSFLLSSSVYAQGSKMAVVNVAKALEESPQAIAANKRLELEFAPRNKALINLRKKLRRYEDRLAKQGMQMSESQLRKLERNVRDTKREIRRAQEDYREDLNIRRNEELRKLQKRVKRAIIRVASKNNYDIVVGEGVLYSSKKVDITDEILKALSDELKNVKSASPKAPAIK
ncbi:MAG TPA: OmpH family outer membrane protein [Gammaproteobacteria bacterium]|nr:OmpH family outer membrane protein [Gammaproteobacteria bacterium]